MRRIQVGPGVVVLACSLALLSGVPTGTLPDTPVDVRHSSGTAPTPLRIMPLGASSTVGEGSPETAGYRGPLQRRLAADGLTVDLVGSRSDGPVPDPDHEGYGGITLTAMTPQVARWVRQADPDVILLHNGTNDLLNGDSPAAAAGHLADALDAIVEVSDAHVVVAGVWAPMPGQERRREQFERRAATIVAGFVERGHSMRFVDATGLLPADAVADGLHPNAAGYRRIAAMWERQVLDVLDVSPAPPRPGARAAAY